MVGGPLVRGCEGRVRPDAFLLQLWCGQDKNVR